MAGIDVQGTSIKIGDGGTPTEVFTKIAHAQGFDGPTTTRNEIDVTTMDSTAREYKVALKDNGTFSFEILEDPSDAGQVALLALENATAPTNFQVELTDMPQGGSNGTTINFAAFLQSAPMSGATDDVVKRNVTLRITGDITYTAAA